MSIINAEQAAEIIGEYQRRQAERLKKAADVEIVDEILRIAGLERRPSRFELADRLSAMNKNQINP